MVSPWPVAGGAGFCQLFDRVGRHGGGRDQMLLEKVADALDDDGATSLTVSASDITNMPNGTTEMVLRRAVEAEVSEASLHGELFTLPETKKEETVERKSVEVVPERVDLIARRILAIGFALPAFMERVKA
ncbi:MAG: hypothetical protein RJB10_746, partial [Pseudomonadota bacterium]